MKEATKRYENLELAGHDEDVLLSAANALIERLETYVYLLTH